MSVVNPKVRLDDLREDQTLRWQQGERPPVEQYLRAHPNLSDEDALVLIVGELLLRWEAGESPTLAEYQRRLPQYAEQIAFQFELNESMDGSLSDEASDHPSNQHEPDPQPGSDTESSEPVPGYVLESELGQGPQGTVYRAINPSLHRSVAVKILRWDPIQDPAATNQFLSRGRTLVKLDHPHLNRVYQTGRSHSQLYIVSDLCEGNTLADRFQTQVLSVEELTETILILAQAAGYAHDRGLILGNIHPGNVIYDSEGRAKLTDFATLPLFHTNSYSPQPDDWHFAEPDPAWDLYALGAILYEGLVGRPPGGPAAMPPHRLNPAVNPELSKVVMRCLEHRPERRYSSAQALVADLRRLRLASSPTASKERAATRTRRIPIGLIWAGVFLVLLAAVLLGWYWIRQSNT